mgnify:CR=1 FL=1
METVLAVVVLLKIPATVPVQSTAEHRVPKMGAMQVRRFMVAEAVHQVVGRQAGLGEDTTLVIQPPQVLVQAQAGAVLAQVETAEIILAMVVAMAAVVGVMVRAAPLAGLAEQEVRLEVQAEVEVKAIQALVAQEVPLD